MITSRPQILIVEDSDVDAVALKAAIRQSLGDAVDVHHVGSMRAVAELLTRTSVDVVLLDLTLPDSIGMETVQRLRDLANGVPIIVVTGHDDNGIRLQAMAGGISAYLKKGDVDTCRQLGVAIVTALDQARRHTNEHDRIFSRLDAIHSLMIDQTQRVCDLSQQMQAVSNELFGRTNINGARISGLVDMVAWHQEYFGRAAKILWIALAAAVTGIIGATIAIAIPHS